MDTDFLSDVLGEFYEPTGKYACAYVGKLGFAGSMPKPVHSPIDGLEVGQFPFCDGNTRDNVVIAAQSAFKQWRTVPAPKRGELLRVFAQRVRTHKQDLARIITLECGKPYQESLGEVQEVIDVCDFAVGLSRQLYGLTIASERPNHRMMEQWHPLGVVLIITAFNFPMAVWAWNAALALICGNTLVWKPSEQCPLSALACHKLLIDTCHELDMDMTVSSIVFADKAGSEHLVDNKNVSLVSATGSCAMGKQVAQRVAARMGKYLLELGGNNAMIVTPSANLPLAVRAAVFAAVGTTGQRCTSLRRLIVHESLEEEMCKQIIQVYRSVKIGNPFDEENLIGPLIGDAAYLTMMESIEAAKAEGGRLLYGGERVLQDSGGVYITPAIIAIHHDAKIVQQETFAPLLYVMTYQNLEEAIEIQNSVDQGLSSAIFTENVREAELFLSAVGSDCGIANVNIGTSGAEIGGAFGGEKDTGGGRESGSDAWKAYMRRATNTINYGTDLPLAQGIKFDV